ncbi:hypothetical protein [Aureimonas frigidaquae]|uniref:Transmembrane protein n=1 Tax=Aureimonas frigidaquae TaxID=424757 RepID=A0A0P0Z066_9HYPH|nr:hypothetical protein [Aureimonas frigidaquae]BAT27266.1 hypothetical protein [Aureimonas frigidaquae]
MVANRTRDNLWTLILTPTVWAVHFLLCYVAAAWHCAPNQALFEPIGGVRIAILVATVVALAICGWVGLRAITEWRGHGGHFPHDGDSASVRERFLEFSSFLLAAMSFLAIIFTAMPALLIVDCR